MCWGREAFTRICWLIALKWFMKKAWSWKSFIGQNSFGNFCGCSPTYPLSSLHDTWPISCASHSVLCSFWGLLCCLFCQSGRWTGVGLEIPGLPEAQFCRCFIYSLENLNAFGFRSDLEQMWISGCQNLELINVMEQFFSDQPCHRQHTVVVARSSFERELIN